MDTSNKFGVKKALARGTIAEMVCFTVAGDLRVLKADDAVLLAAWLVALADPKRAQFDRVFQEISQPTA